MTRSVLLERTVQLPEMGSRLNARVERRGCDTPPDALSDLLLKNLLVFGSAALVIGGALYELPAFGF